MTRMWMIMALVLVGGVGSLGCVNEDLVFDELTLTGTVTVVNDSSGAALHLEFHHAVSGTGELEHPLGLIEAIELDPGERSLEHELLVPRDVGEGLVVYAWLDRDGDGVLCGLDGDDAEPAGAVALEFPPRVISFELTLDQPCVGPELAIDP